MPPGGQFMYCIKLLLLLTETMLYFLYNEEIKDDKLINPNLLFAADKYNIAKLVKICILHLKTNLSKENALDILLGKQIKLLIQQFLLDSHQS